MILGTIALFRGFYIGNGVDSGAWYAPPVLTLPTASAKWRGQILLLDKLGAADDETYVCVKTSSGYAWKLAA
jgi:hypothetical protein